MSNKLEPLDDFELDRLLSAASNPPEMAGFESKLLAQIRATRLPETAHDNVVPLFKPKAPALPPQTATRKWAIGAAMAASLVMGVFLGNGTDVTNLFDGLSNSSSSDQVAEFAPAGLDEIGVVDEEKQS